MKRIEHLIAGGKCFHIDPSACMQHAESIRLFKPSQEVHAWSHLPKSTQLVFKVAFISICHQMNWDFLQDALARNLLSNNANILENLSNVSPMDISAWLGNYPKKERIRAKERAHLLRDVFQVLATEFNSDPDYFYQNCAEAQLGNNGFHALLDKFESYRTDPLRKKTNVLTHDLYKEKIVNFSDSQNIEPAVDYHIMRLYLRTGRVVPADESIFSFLEGEPKPRGSLVRQLRRQVSEAAKLTAYYANLNVAEVNYIEWQIGRSICHNKQPECQKTEGEILVAKDVRKLFTGRCPYMSSCLSYNQLPRFIDFEEPIYISKHY